MSSLGGGMNRFRRRREIEDTVARIKRGMMRPSSSGRDLDSVIAQANTSTQQIAALTAQVTALTNSLNALISSTSGNISAIRVAVGQAGLAAVLGGTLDVTITWSSPLPVLTYKVEVGMIVKGTWAEKSRTQSGMVITITAGVAIVLGAAVFVAEASC
jgi:hypothetical protein